MARADSGAISGLGAKELSWTAIRLFKFSGCPSESPWHCRARPAWDSDRSEGNGHSESRPRPDRRHWVRARLASGSSHRSESRQPTAAVQQGFGLVSAPLPLPRAGREPQRPLPLVSAIPGQAMSCPAYSAVNISADWLGAAAGDGARPSCATGRMSSLLPPHSGGQRATAEAASVVFDRILSLRVEINMSLARRVSPPSSNQ